MVKSKQKKESSFDKCNGILEDFFENANLPLCSKYSTFYLNHYVVDHLIKEGYSEFLSDDVSGFQTSESVSERVLIKFAEQQRVFSGRTRKNYVIKEVYGVHSVRLFEAWPIN
ncbi:MAG TPA: hypothetical protein P5277_03960 [Candidatus Paceibacterota bacterium]|nr:hypothetical protein [Candidatus Paceibacterota bacterium]